MDKQKRNVIFVMERCVFYLTSPWMGDHLFIPCQ